jgi:hypothetical protein
MLKSVGVSIGFTDCRIRLSIYVIRKIVLFRGKLDNKRKNVKKGSLGLSLKIRTLY